MQKFSLVLANFPFSDHYWWLKPEQQTDDKTKKARLKKEIFGKEGYKDPFGRFGRGTGFRAPPPKYGDYAFVLHILASLSDAGRAGVVCPQGVLFRGQPEVEEETGDFDGGGKPKVRRRKADDEHLIRRALLESRLIDAVVSLPLNVFYGAGVPACLLILRKQRPAERRDRVLLIYAARHYRELSAQNELRPQDVMRMLVHYHAYGDASKARRFVAEHSERIHREINHRETDEVGRLEAEYQSQVDRLAAADAALQHAREKQRATETKRDQAKSASTVTKLLKQRARAAAKVAERDERIAEAHRIAEEDRVDVLKVGEELVTLYSDPDELNKHARVVDVDEVEGNQFNLNVPRYVDTFEPEPRIAVRDVLRDLANAQTGMEEASANLTRLLSDVGYAD